tara:strand:+ start:330 stop:527 length:198 start_codon:yes stop_codon:yes gene_type:complete
MKANKIDKSPINTRKETIGVINIPIDIHSTHPFRLPRDIMSNCEMLSIKAKITQKCPISIVLLKT